MKVICKACKAVVNNHDFTEHAMKCPALPKREIPAPKTNPGMTERPKVPGF